MKFRMLSVSIALLLLLSLSAAGSRAADKPSKAMPQATPEFIEKGKKIYFKRCSFCHGLLGDGNGPAADFMDPRPRDFTLGTFKFRTTQSGELPTNEDLFRVVSRGLSGTGMQAFDNELIKSGLTEDERWQVISYVKTFAQEFANPDFDPYKKVIKLPSSKVSYSAESVEKGKEVFKKAKCWECHGMLGRGDGQKSFDRKDDWGFPIRIRNVTLPWKIKSGTEVEDIFMRFSTGINGTPMPSFADTLSEEERWYLANFIKSLQVKPSDNTVLKAKLVKEEIPLAPGAKVWGISEPIGIRMAGQVVAAPRWQNPSIEMVSVRSVFNDKEIGFLLEWDDPFKDVKHNDAAEFNAKDIMNPGAYNSYVAANNMITRQLETFRDSVALQFPVSMKEGTKKPHFFRGGGNDPVNLWVWKADLFGEGKPAAEEGGARGFKQPVKAQAPEEQQVSSGAVWKEGRWSVVMKRPLVTNDKGDVQFEKGKFIPIAANAWDGSNGEHGNIMSLSSWHFVFLEAPTPAKVYAYAGFGVVFAGLFEFWLVRRNGRRKA